VNQCRDMQSQRRPGRQSATMAASRHCRTASAQQEGAAGQDESQLARLGGTGGHGWRYMLAIVDKWEEGVGL
jgi:hypothetical protein